jgi:hypothetical protein
MQDTRYPELKYVREPDGESRAYWRIVDVNGGHYDQDSGLGGRVGPMYRTKSELLADLDRFAALFGCA